MIYTLRTLASHLLMRIAYIASSKSYHPFWMWCEDDLPYYASIIHPEDMDSLDIAVDMGLVSYFTHDEDFLDQIARDKHQGEVSEIDYSQVPEII